MTMMASGQSVSVGCARRQDTLAVVIHLDPIINSGAIVGHHYWLVLRLLVFGGGGS